MSNLNTQDRRGLSLEGRTALVTGANRGIGAAITDALLAAGCSRVHACMRTPQPSTDPRIAVERLDITKPADVEGLAARLPEVSLVVNNAGVLQGGGVFGPLESAELEMRTNYFGTLAMCRAFAPVLAANGGGGLVNLLSILSQLPMPPAASYSASKAAALSMTRSVRAALASQGTLVMAVMPAFVDTDMAKAVPGEKLSPEQVAQTVITAIQEGIEDVYPGPAAQIAANIQRDPRGMERQLAGFALE